MKALLATAVILALGVLAAAEQRAPANATRAAAPPTLSPAHDAAAEVLVFEGEIEAAVVRGDAAFVDAATAPTFTFTHGDGWTTGGAPLRVDTRADWMARSTRKIERSHEGY